MKNSVTRATTILATGMAAALLMTACGDDSEQTSPMAPTAIGESGTGTTNPAMAGANGASGNGASARTSATAARGNDLGNAEMELNEPIMFGELPPGTSSAQLQGMIEERNAQLNGGIYSARRSRPGRVRNLNVYWDGLMIMNWERPSNPSSGSIRYQVEWERLHGLPCRTPHVTAVAARLNCTKGLQTSDQIAYLDLNREVWTDDYYKIWVQAQVGGVGGSWALAVVKAEPGAEPPPEPVPVPSSISVTSAGWTCDTSRNNGCSRELTIKGVGSSDDATIELQQLQNGRWSTRSTGNVGYTVDLKPSSYYFRAREIDGDRMSEWSARERVQNRPSRSDVANAGAVPSAPQNVLVKLAERRTQREDSEEYITYERWKVSWDPPSAPGGWELTEYRYGDTGPDVNQDSLGRSCKGNGWPGWQFGTDSNTNQGGEEGRQYGVEVVVVLPEEWTISMTAINLRGEGSCAAGDRSDE